MKKYLTALGFFFFIGLLWIGVLLTWHRNSALADSSDPVEIYALATKEDADCILIHQGDANILIDTAEDADGESIVSFLNEHEITTIEYLILTHEDKDHIGSAARIAKSFSIHTVIIPYLPNPNEEMQALQKLFTEKQIQVIIPTRTRNFTIGSLNFAVYPPLKKNYSKDNDYSLGILVNHGKVNMLFLGDAQNKRAKELLNVHWPQKIALMKAPYHGRYQANIIPLLEKIAPECTIITSTRADQEIVDVLTAKGSQIYYTGAGTVAFVSDGVSLTSFNTGE